MPRITFVPQCVAERICGEFDFTISIMPPGEAANIAGSFVSINFDDTEMPCAGLVMFDTEMALRVMSVGTNIDDDGSLLVHCQAGMSRSAAVAKWLADHHGYELWMHPEGVGTLAYYNRHVYRTMNAADGKDMAAYYADLEMKERMMGN